MESTEYIVGQRRKEALKIFQFFDSKAQPLNVSQTVTEIKLKPTSAVVVTGYLAGQTTGFAINLTCKTSGNVALHFNPRLDRGYVVRNSKSRGYWDDEETCSPAVASSSIFRRDAYFHVVIFCGAYDFLIAVNGEHFCEFHYRLPLDTINRLELVGGVEDVRTRLTTLCIYPDPKICKPSRNLKLTEQHPLLENLGSNGKNTYGTLLLTVVARKRSDLKKVPVTVAIAQEFRHGARIFIKGRLKLLPHSFYVNLQKGRMIYPHPEIGLHLNPRFQYGSRPACVVMNCWTEGSWSNEERHEGHLSWGPGRDFLLTIRCEYEGYMIWLGDKMIGEFKHRLQPSIVDTLKISGDLVLYEIAMSYA